MASSTFSGKQVALAVTGGIAAYKAASLCSRLVQAGAAVDVILTDGAARFVAPLTFSALTRRPVHTDAWDEWTPDAAGHVTLAERADVLVVAPATANAIARLALGLAGDLLGTVALSTRAPLVVAPAMEHHMWSHPATQANVATLRSRSATIVGPDAGRLASGAEGLGRLAPEDEILAAVAVALDSPVGPLCGARIVVTAGGTHEAIDPVRFIGNRSSGTMGYAIADELRRQGAAVVLVSGPTVLEPPVGVETRRVESALEMLAATEAAVADADALVMAAAVADYRPETVADRKIKKRPGEDTLDLHLVRNPDILATIRRPGLVKIGFAAETDDLLANAQRKLEDKDLAMIVANDATATIGQPDSEATIIRRDRPPRTLPRMDKRAVAREIAAEVSDLLGRSG